MCRCMCVCYVRVHVLRLLANKQLQDTAPHLAISSHSFSSLSQNSWSARCFCSCRLNSSAHSPLLPGATTCKVCWGTGSNITRKGYLFQGLYRTVEYVSSTHQIISTTEFSQPIPDTVPHQWLVSGLIPIPVSVEPYYTSLVPSPTPSFSSLAVR